MPMEGGALHTATIEKDNEQLAQAYALVLNTNSSFFLTGKAGTGKTTFLRRIQQEIDKNFIVLAPTGAAAILVGGETIHSFLGLPPEVITPHTQLRINERKRELIRAADTVIVDEASMVRCDVVDAMDRAFRAIMHNGLPFGGKQVIFAGDMFQLEPIAERGVVTELLRDMYECDRFYFYKAHVFKRFNMPRIELQEVYRQDDPVFLGVLNNVRNYKLTADDLKILNNRVCEPEESDMSIVLSPYHRTVDEINNRRLESLPGEALTFEAEMDGKFNPDSAPVDAHLKLKVGAQVMFARNDAERRWVNGTLAEVVGLKDDEVRVRLNDGTEHVVGRIQWEAYEQKYDRKTKTIEKELIGTFTQYPLRLAWAITIHKSQGMTFDKMVLDLSRGVFTSGQLYVALSRVRSLKGLYLTDPVRYGHVRENAEIMAFANTFNDNALIQDELSDGAAIYPHLRKRDYDEAARVCFRLALKKVDDGKLRDASLMFKKMLDIVICDDCLIGMIENLEPLKAEGMVADFINAVLCLYGGAPELGIAYADRVLERREDCIEAHYVKSRSLALLDRWADADAENIRIMKLLDNDFDKDPKAVLWLSVVNKHVGDPSLDSIQYVVITHGSYMPAMLELRHQLKDANLKLKTDKPTALTEAITSDMSDEDFVKLCRETLEANGEDYMAFLRAISKQKF